MDANIDKNYEVAKAIYGQVLKNRVGRIVSHPLIFLPPHRIYNS